MKTKKVFLFFFCFNLHATVDFSMAYLNLKPYHYRTKLFLIAGNDFTPFKRESLFRADAGKFYFNLNYRENKGRATREYKNLVYNVALIYP